MRHACQQGSAPLPWPFSLRTIGPGVADSPVVLGGGWVARATSAVYRLGYRSPVKILGRADQERWRRLHRRVLTFALSWVIGAAKRFGGFDLVVSGASTPSFSDRFPSLVLARHGGPGDSFVLVHLLLTNYDADVRIVLKEVLQLDPALDVLLNRLGCCFVPARCRGDGFTSGWHVGNFTDAWRHAPLVS